MWQNEKKNENNVRMPKNNKKWNLVVSKPENHN